MERIAYVHLGSVINRTIVERTAPFFIDLREPMFLRPTTRKPSNRADEQLKIR